MNIERTQYIGHYGVTFTVLRLIVLPANQHAMENLCLLEAGTSANEVRQRLIDLYGIGPQRSESAMVIPFMGGTRR